MTEEIEYPEAIKYPEYDSTDFVLNILSMEAKEVNGVTNVVYHVEYEIVATLASGTVRKFEGGVEYLDEHLMNVENFKEFDALTEADIKNWIESYTDVENIKRGLTMPEKEKTDNSVTLPWTSQQENKT